MQGILEKFHKKKSHLISSGYFDIEIGKIEHPEKTARGYQVAYTLYARKGNEKYKKPSRGTMTFLDEATARKAKFALEAVKSGNEGSAHPSLMGRSVDQNNIGPLLGEFYKSRVQDLIDNHLANPAEVHGLPRSQEDRSFAYAVFAYLKSKDLLSIEKINRDKSAMAGFKSYLYNFIPAEHYEKRYEFYENHLPPFEIKFRLKDLDYVKIRQIIKALREGIKSIDIRATLNAPEKLVLKTKTLARENDWLGKKSVNLTDKEIAEKFKKKNNPISYKGTLPKIFNFFNLFIDFLRDRFDGVYIRNFKDLTLPSKKELVILEGQKHRVEKMRRILSDEEKQQIFLGMDVHWKVPFAMACCAPIRRTKLLQMVLKDEVKLTEGYFLLNKYLPYQYNGKKYISQNKSRRTDIVYITNELQEILEIYLSWRQRWLDIQLKSGCLSKENPPSLFMVTKTSSKENRLGSPRNGGVFYRHFKSVCRKLNLKNIEQLDIHGLKGDRLTKGLTMRMLIDEALDDIRIEGLHQDKGTTLKHYIRQNEELIQSAKRKSMVEYKIGFDLDHLRTELENDLKSDQNLNHGFKKSL